MRTHFLRRIIMAVVALLVILMGYIQVELRRLQHNAERLHAEILALQLEPGTFADVQRLQREWGAFGHSKGTCTAQHCMYRIALADFMVSSTGWLHFDSTAPQWRQYLTQTALFYRGYRLLGGRPTVVTANIQVQDDRVWGANFRVVTAAYPGDKRSWDGSSSGRNSGNEYFVIAAVDWGARLGTGDEGFNLGTLRRGFRTSYEMQCLGCEYVTAAITHQTSREQIERLNRINLGCISRLRTCRHPGDVAPALWETAVQDKASSTNEKRDDTQYCQVAIPLLVRESNDVLLVEVLSVHQAAKDMEPETTVRVLKMMKNGHLTPPGTTFALSSEPKPIYSSAKDFLEEGQQYFILYSQPPPHAVLLRPELQSCHGVPNTPANEADVFAGLKLDPSTEEQHASWSDTD